MVRRVDDLPRSLRLRSWWDLLLAFVGLVLILDSLLPWYGTGRGWTGVGDELRGSQWLASTPWWTSRGWSLGVLMCVAAVIWNIIVSSRVRGSGYQHRLLDWLPLIVALAGLGVTLWSYFAIPVDMNLTGNAAGWTLQSASDAGSERVVGSLHNRASNVRWPYHAATWLMVAIVLLLAGGAARRLSAHDPRKS